MQDYSISLNGTPSCYTVYDVRLEFIFKMVCCLIMIIINILFVLICSISLITNKGGKHIRYTYSEGGLAATTNYDGALTELWLMVVPTLPGFYQEDGSYAST